MTNACDITSYWITFAVTFASFCVWAYWRPQVETIYKLPLQLAFAVYIWNHIYVAWIAGDLADRWPGLHAALLSYEWGVNLLFACVTAAVLGELAKYTAMAVSTAIVWVVTRHTLVLGWSLGLAFVIGVLLHFAMRANNVKHLASILTVSLMCSAVFAFSAVSLAVHDGTSSAFSLHPLPNTLTRNSTALPPQRGANCTAQTVNMLLVCDSDCPVIFDLPDQPAVATTVACVTAAMLVVRLGGILVLKGYKDDKLSSSEDRERTEAAKDDEERKPFFRCRACCRCKRWFRPDAASSPEDCAASSKESGAYGRVPIVFTDVS